MKQYGKQTGSKSRLSHSVILVRKKKKNLSTQIFCAFVFLTQKRMDINHPQLCNKGVLK